MGIRSPLSKSRISPPSLAQEADPQLCAHLLAGCRQALRSMLLPAGGHAAHQKQSLREPWHLLLSAAVQMQYMLVRCSTNAVYAGEVYDLDEHAVHACTCGCDVLRARPVLAVWL